MTNYCKRFKECSFDNFKTNNAYEEDMIKYLRDCVEKGFKENIIITGGVGLGKTHLAYSIINSLEEVKDSRGGNWKYYTQKTAVLVSIKRIIDDIRVCWKKEVDSYDRQRVADYKKLPLLIVDEIGVQYGTDGERLELFDIFNERYNNMLPTIIISNCDKKQISIILGQRIVDRLFGGAKVFELEGVSKR